MLPTMCMMPPCMNMLVKASPSASRSLPTENSSGMKPCSITNARSPRASSDSWYANTARLIASNVQVAIGRVSV
jgi:hypothetical protein